MKSIYAVSDSGLWFELFFHVGLAVAVLYLIGFGGRVTAVARYDSCSRCFRETRCFSTVGTTWRT